jgi:hypothetical protein
MKNAGRNTAARCSLQANTAERRKPKAESKKYSYTLTPQAEYS